MSATRRIRRWTFAFGLVAALCVSATVRANPKGGVTTTEMNRGYRDTVHFDFTPSIGGREYGFRITEYDSFFVGLPGYDPAKLGGANGVQFEYFWHYKAFEPDGVSGGFKLMKLLPLLLILIAAITGWIVLSWKRKRSRAPR